LLCVVTPAYKESPSLHAIRGTLVAGLLSLMVVAPEIGGIQMQVTGVLGEYLWRRSAS